eukprot:3547307-Rhodomonas_salina.1
MRLARLGTSEAVLLQWCTLNSRCIASPAEAIPAARGLRAIEDSEPAHGPPEPDVPDDSAIDGNRFQVKAFGSRGLYWTLALTL